jgi:putative transposase
MKLLSLAYTKAINKRFNRSGVLFQGRFQSIHVTETDYLIHLSRYIHLNPVKAKLVQQLIYLFCQSSHFSGLLTPR